MKSPPVVDAPLFCLTRERKSRDKLRWIILISMRSVVGTWGINWVPYLKAVYKLRRQGNIQRLNEVRDVLIGASKQTHGATLQDGFFFFLPMFIHHGGQSSALYQILSALAKLTFVVVLSYDSASTTRRLHLLHNATRILERALQSPQSNRGALFINPEARCELLTMRRQGRRCKVNPTVAEKNRG